MKIARHALIKICDSNFEPFLRKRQPVDFSINSLATCGNEMFVMTFTAVNNWNSTFQ